jgi:hypothetical protein
VGWVVKTVVAETKMVDRRFGFCFWHLRRHRKDVVWFSLSSLGQCRTREFRFEIVIGRAKQRVVPGFQLVFCVT